tara:strand:+ start:400 stop:612 length:213 start_codon:yes stop_codon:yes gene_type:complete
MGKDSELIFSWGGGFKPWNDLATMKHGIIPCREEIELRVPLIAVLELEPSSSTGPSSIGKTEEYILFEGR